MITVDLLNQITVKAAINISYPNTYKFASLIMKLNVSIILTFLDESTGEK